MAWKEPNQTSTSDLLKRGSPLKRKDTDSVVRELMIDVGMILEYKSRLALGKLPPEGFECYNTTEMDRILKIAEPMIQSHQQTKKLKVESTNQILKALSAGKVTVKEAIELMTLLSARYDVEEKEANSVISDKIKVLLK